MFSIAGDVTPDGAVREGPILINGSTTLDDAATLEIVFDDGKSVTVPVVWVSEPIDAGFYGYEVPREKWAVGRRPRLLILRDADGRELRRDSSAFEAPWFRPGPSDSLAECLFRRGGKPCLDAAVGKRGPSKTREEPARPPRWVTGDRLDTSRRRVRRRESVGREEARSPGPPSKDAITRRDA
jgi:hypothetical protein